MRVKKAQTSSVRKGSIVHSGVESASVCKATQPTQCLPLLLLKLHESEVTCTRKS